LNGCKITSEILKEQVMSKVKTPPPLRQVATCLLFAAVVLASAPMSSQATVIPPIGLAPGSQYQLIFVTADTTTATSADINYYNTFVQREAADNPLLPSATWFAVASTPTVDAGVNALTHINIPIYNTQGQLVATGPDLYGQSIEAAVEYDQSGNTLPQGAVWTGTNLFRAGLNPLGQDAEAEVGLDHATTTRWLSDEPEIVEGTALPLYALSTVITSPVPEPATLSLLVSALLGLAGAFYLRRRRAKA
jgi:hypothetical protein